MGNVVTLRVRSLSLEVLEVNNTGLVVAAGTATHITSYNLTFTTNAPSEQGINIRSARALVSRHKYLFGRRKF